MHANIDHGRIIIDRHEGVVVGVVGNLLNSHGDVVGDGGKEMSKIREHIRHRSCGVRLG